MQSRKVNAKVSLGEVKSPDNFDLGARWKCVSVYVHEVDDL